MASKDTLIRSIVRGIYDLQDLRIKTGQRLSANFYLKLGKSTEALDKEEIDRLQAGILTKLKADYARMTDGVACEGADGLISIPTRKRFVPTGLISTYSEAIMTSNYLKLLEDEEQQFKKLGAVLDDYPIWTEFLQKVDGIGPAIAGVLISEIDIEKAEYPSSLAAYAGLDVVTAAEYTDAKGARVRVRPCDHSFEVMTGPKNEAVFRMDGQYDVDLVGVGRNRHKECLIDREYVTADGETALKKSLSGNPFLKTKLIGILGPSFLKAGKKTFVDGVKMGAAKRKSLLESFGEKVPATMTSDAVDERLRALGREVTYVIGKYAEAYYSYRNRLANMPKHQEKTAKHRHNMAIRYMVKLFLTDYYVVARTMAGLPVAPSYEEAKLGLVHGKMTCAKESDVITKALAQIELRTIAKAIEHSIPEKDAVAALLKTDRFSGLLAA